MPSTKAVTVRLDAEDYAQLQAKAEQLGMKPGTLARVLIRSELKSAVDSKNETRWQRGMKALDQARELAAELPPVDAVRVLQEARDELEQRPYL